MSEFARKAVKGRCNDNDDIDFSFTIERCPGQTTNRKQWEPLQTNIGDYWETWWIT